MKPAASKKPRLSKHAGTLPDGDDVGASELGRQIGDKLRAERQARGLSLDELARASGVSRAALSQIETHKSSPSINILWKIATGLGIAFSELLDRGDAQGTVLRRSDAQVLRSPDGRFESRPVAPAGITPWVEVYELRLTARSRHTSEKHAAGTREILVVLSGSMRVSVGARHFELDAGDSVSFMADVPHVYENPGSAEARCHNVILYAHS